MEQLDACRRSWQTVERGLSQRPFLTEWQQRWAEKDVEGLEL